jgi:hypothetical protein
VPKERGPRPYAPTRRQGGTGCGSPEGVNDFGSGRVSNVVAIFELEDGKIRRDTRHYAEPLEPNGWRAHLVERMES